MNIIERIESDLPNRTPDRHSVWWVTVREDDVRALVRLVKAVQSIPRVEGDSLRFWFDTYGEHWRVMATTLAALEEPCE